MCRYMFYCFCHFKSLNLKVNEKNHKISGKKKTPSKDHVSIKCYITGQKADTFNFGFIAYLSHSDKSLLFISPNFKLSLLLSASPIISEMEAKRKTMTMLAWYARVWMYFTLMSTSLLLKSSSWSQKTLNEDKDIRVLWTKCHQWPTVAILLNINEL